MDEHVRKYFLGNEDIVYGRQVGPLNIEEDPWKSTKVKIRRKKSSRLR
jgi:hypothetical protein